MRLLVDTHLLLWAANADKNLSELAKTIVEDEGNELFFSSASIWEVAIKRGLGRDDFDANPAELRNALLENGWAELAATGGHAAAVDYLPQLHKDPFDRILLAPAMIDGLALLTADKALAAYPGPIQKV